MIIIEQKYNKCNGLLSAVNTEIIFKHIHVALQKMERNHNKKVVLYLKNI